MNDKSHIKVGDVMTKSIRMTNAMATVQDAVDEMREAGVSSLVVEPRDDHDEFGLLVITDIARHVIAENRSADRVNVYEVMSKPVLTLAPDMALKYAVRLLVRFGLSRALVVDTQREPVGLVTLRDMVLRHEAT